MTSETFIERLADIGFMWQTTGWKEAGGHRARGFRHPSITQEGSLFVKDDCVVGTGPYAELSREVAPSGHGPKGYPFWSGDALDALRKCLEAKLLSKGVRDVLDAFDALPPAEQHQAATAILRRSAGSGEMPDAAFEELAAESFRTYDAEEAPDANPYTG